MADDIIISVNLNDKGLKAGFDKLATVTKKFTTNVRHLVQIQKKLDARQKKIVQVQSKSTQVVQKLAKTTDKLAIATKKNTKEQEISAAKQEKLLQNSIIFKKELQQLDFTLKKLGLSFQDVGIKEKTLSQAQKGHTAEMGQIRKAVGLTRKEIAQQSDVVNTNKKRFSNLQIELKKYFATLKSLKVSQDTITKAQQGNAQAVKILERAFKTLKQETSKLSQANQSVVKTSKTASKAIDKQSASVGLLGTRNRRLLKSNQQLAMSFATLRSRMLLISFAFGLGIRQAIKFANVAAQVDAMGKAFVNLQGGSIQASISLEKLKIATDGTMSEFDLFQQSNNAMILGISKNSDEMARLFDMAQRLGRALGVDTKRSVESLVTGIGRQSKLMLDNIGIMVNSKDAYKDYAEEIGKSVDKLTDSEKKQAFMTAALEAGEEALRALGPEILGVTDSFGKFDAEAQNLSKRIGDLLTPAMATLAETSAGIFKFFDEERLKAVAVIIGTTLVTAMAALATATNKVAIALGRTGIGALVVGFGLVTTELIKFTGIFKEAKPEIEDTAEFQREFNKRLNEFTDTGAILTAEKFTEIMNTLKEELKAVKNDFSKLNEEVEVVNFGPVTGGFRRYVTKVTEGTKTIHDEMQKQLAMITTQGFDQFDMNAFVQKVEDRILESGRKRPVTGSAQDFLEFDDTFEAEIAEQLGIAQELVKHFVDDMSGILQGAQEGGMTFGDLFRFHEISDVIDGELVVDVENFMFILQKMIQTGKRLSEDTVQLAFDLKNQKEQQKALNDENEKSEKVNSNLLNILNEHFEKSDEFLAVKKRMYRQMIMDAAVLENEGKLNAQQIIGLQGLKQAYLDLFDAKEKNKTVDEQLTEAFNNSDTARADRLFNLLEEAKLLNDHGLLSREAAAGLKIMQEEYDNLIGSSENSTKAQLSDFANLANALGALAGANKGNKLQAARLSQAGAIIDTYAGANKAFEQGGTLGFVTAAAIIAQGLANVVQIENQLNKMSGTSGSGTIGSFEYGGLVGGQRHSQGGTIIEAERGEFVMSRNAVESIGLETLNQMNQGGSTGNVVINVSGNVMTQDFVEGELAESIKEAVRKGSDFGLS